MRTILIAGAVCCLFSCKTEKKKQGLGEKQRQIETGTLDSTNQYKAEQVGWTMDIHPDWEVQTKEETKRLGERGQKAMEETINAEVDASELVQLINLRKGRFNSFMSTI
jgi:hypothetical protein